MNSPNDELDVVAVTWRIVPPRIQLHALRSSLARWGYSETPVSNATIFTQNWFPPVIVPMDPSDLSEQTVRSVLASTGTSPAEWLDILCSDVAEIVLNRVACRRHHVMYSSDSPAQLVIMAEGCHL